MSKKEKEKPDLMSRIIDQATKDDDYVYVYNSGEQENFLIPNHYYRTGISVIDRILGDGGFASSKISEIYGPNKSGKSELAQAVVEKFLIDHPDGIAQYFDQETALDDKKFQQIPIFGCGRLIVRKGKTMEKCFSSIQDTATILDKEKIRRPILYVFDSVAAIETEEESKKEIGKSTYAPQARVLSQALRKIRGVLLRTDAHLLLVNQTRDKPGEMFNTNDSACGNAIKFYADYRIKMNNIGIFRFSAKKKGEEDSGPDGFKIQVTTVKNKRTIPVRKVEVPLIFHSIGGYRSGLSDVWSLWYELKKWDILKTAKTGGWHCLVTASGKSEPMTRSEFLQLYSDSIDSTSSGRIKEGSQLAEALREYTSKIMDSKVNFSSSDDDDDGDEG
jgi:RecA/RadA recombinase